MKNPFSLLLVLCATLLLLDVTSSCGTANALVAVPTFTFNLSLPASQRWRGAVAKVLTQHAWEDSFGPLLDLTPKGNSTTICPYTAALLPLLRNATAMERVERHFRRAFPDWYAEIEGLASDFSANRHPEINSTFLVAWSYSYEMGHVQPPTSATISAQKQQQQQPQCAAILVLANNTSSSPTPSSEISVVHGRNMDAIPLTLRNFTMRVQAVRGDVVVYESLDWLWFFGGSATITARTPSSTTPSSVNCEMNTRINYEQSQAGDASSMTFDSVVQRITSDRQGEVFVPVEFVCRHLAERAVSSSQSFYDVAAEFVAKGSFVHTAAPTYIILSSADPITTQPHGTATLSSTQPPPPGAVFTLSVNSSFNKCRTFVSSCDAFAKPPASSSSSSLGGGHHEIRVQTLVQTNHDVPEKYTWIDPRRTAALEALETMGISHMYNNSKTQSASLQQQHSQQGRHVVERKVFAALSTYPVHNVMTVYSVLFHQAGEDGMWVEGYTRQAMLPITTLPPY